MHLFTILPLSLLLLLSTGALSAEATTLYDCSLIEPKNQVFKENLDKSQDMKNYALTLHELCNQTTKFLREDYKILIDLYDTSRQWYQNPSLQYDVLKDNFDETQQIQLKDLPNYFNSSSELDNELQTKNISKISDARTLKDLLAFKIRQTPRETNKINTIKNVFTSDRLTTLQNSYNNAIVSIKNPTQQNSSTPTVPPNNPPNKPFDIASILQKAAVGLFLVLMGLTLYLQKRILDQLLQLKKELTQKTKPAPDKSAGARNVSDYGKSYQESSGDKKYRTQEQILLRLSEIQNQLDRLANSSAYGNVAPNYPTPAVPAFTFQEPILSQEEQNQRRLEALLQKYYHHDDDQMDSDLKVSVTEASQQSLRSNPHASIKLEAAGGSKFQYFLFEYRESGHQYIALPKKSKFNKQKIELTGLANLYNFTGTGKIKSIEQPALVEKQGDVFLVASKGFLTLEDKSEWQYM